MHQRELRTVLLIQAIEETDRAGEVIPLADRLMPRERSCVIRPRNVRRRGLQRRFQLSRKRSWSSVPSACSIA